MGMVCHGLEIREAIRVDNGVAFVVVVVHSRGSVGRAALLPGVVEADVAVSQIAQRSRPVVVLAHHALHDRLDQRLVYFGAEQVPTSPAQRGREGEPVVVREDASDWPSSGSGHREDQSWGPVHRAVLGLFSFCLLFPFLFCAVFFVWLFWFCFSEPSSAADRSVSHYSLTLVSLLVSFGTRLLFPRKIWNYWGRRRRTNSRTVM